MSPMREDRSKNGQRSVRLKAIGGAKNEVSRRESEKESHLSMIGVLPNDSENGRERKLNRGREITGVIDKPGGKLIAVDAGFGDDEGGALFTLAGEVTGVICNKERSFDETVDLRKTSTLGRFIFI